MLDVLQETLLYIEQQHEWLSYLQSAIAEKEQKYKLLHEKIAMKITEQLTELKLVDFCKDNIVVKQECCHENENYCTSSNTNSLVGFESSDGNNFTHNNPATTHMPHESQFPYNADAMNESEDIDQPTANEACSNFDNLNYSSDGNENELQDSDTDNALIASDHANFCELNSKKSENSPLGFVKIEFQNKESFYESVNGPASIQNEHDAKSIDIQENVGQISAIASTGTDVDRFQCFICHKLFTSKGNLSQHIRIIHGSERPSYQCSFCQKNFTKLGNLNQHLHLHTGEKPFVCIHCNRGFARKFTLKKHILTHNKQIIKLNPQTMN